MTPLGIESLPSDLVKALRVLPEVSDQLARIAASTGEMSGLRAGIDGLGEDTRALGQIADDVARVAAATDLLPEIRSAVGDVTRDTSALPDVAERLEHVRTATEVLPSVDGRMKSIEAAMPALADVQQHLAGLPETIETLGAGIDRLAGLMDRLLVSIETLDANVGSLHESMEPIARLADRLPGGGGRD